MILWLGDEDCHEVQRVGGKAANLSRLAPAFAFPPGSASLPTCTNSGMTAKRQLNPWHDSKLIGCKPYQSKKARSSEEERAFQNSEEPLSRTGGA